MPIEISEKAMAEAQEAFYDEATKTDSDTFIISTLYEELSEEREPKLGGNYVEMPTIERAIEIYNNLETYIELSLANSVSTLDHESMLESLMTPTEVRKVEQCIETFIDTACKEMGIDNPIAVTDEARRLGLNAAEELSSTDTISNKDEYQDMLYTLLDDLDNANTLKEMKRSIDAVKQESYTGDILHTKREMVKKVLSCGEGYVNAVAKEMGVESPMGRSMVN